ncbi:MAG: hypothetical protein GYB65_11840, partial [Chloroflexi bacterium]|nr:hypothetical protein [Chloroflexota bacterium]
YIYDDEADFGVIEFLRPVDSVQFVLHPDDMRVMVRRASGAQPIELYNLDSGVLERQIFPAMRDPGGDHILAFDGSGDVIVSNFQRFDTWTGEVLYEDLHYHPGFGDYFFSSDSRSLVTLTGSEWWRWDIATGEVIERQQLDLRGSRLRTSADGHRFLTRVDSDAGPVMELTDIGTGQRFNVTINDLPGRQIQDIVPSPTWENFIVVYSANDYDPYYPGNMVALYSLYEGQQWFLAGDDLPPSTNRSYSWLDDETVMISSREFGDETQPARVYGLDFDLSGLPACLVQAFPNDWPDWIDLWERLNERLRADELGYLTERLCAVLPGTVDDVNAVLFPSPTPTRYPVTATPALIAGVPTCLTNRFEAEASEYARIWREMTEGMTPDEMAEFEVLLCEGLAGASMMGPPGEVDEDAEDPLQVMTINIETGVRAEGAYIPERQEPPSRSLQLVLDAFDESQGFTPSGALLSPDGELLVTRNSRDHLVIYRLVTPYQTLAGNPTATAAPRDDEPIMLAVFPTPTQPFDRVGGPRPTLTPTITPTSPPRPVDVIDQPRYGEIEEVCGSDALYDISNPPPDYAASGALLVTVQDYGGLSVFDATNGDYYADELLPGCIRQGSCDFSFDREWMVWIHDGNLVVSRPDGSQERVLFLARDEVYWPSDLRWIPPHTLEYSFETYVPDERDPVRLVQQFDPASPVTPEPLPPLPSVRVNELRTETLSAQPGGGPLRLVRTSFNTGRSTGYKYYIVDRDTGAVDYFARLAADSGNDLSTTWHPLGWALYYRYSGTASDEWYVFDTQTREHRLLGVLPGGDWSRDGRYRVDWYSMPSDQREERQEAGLPIPKITIWDSQTGLMRRYCIPQTEDRTYSGPLYWSPDSRYLAFTISLPADDNSPLARPHTLVLDTETGTVTELSFDIVDIFVWTDDVADRGWR